MNKDYKLYVHIAPNGKRYYGITKQTINQRWRNGKGYDTQYFARAINKYGWDNIEHIVLQEGLDEEEAKELEQYMIQWYNTNNKKYGYNVSYGGDVNSECTEETRRKLSESHKGIRPTEETRQKMSKARKGKYHSEETKQKISEAKKGEKHHMYGKRGKLNPNYGMRHSEKTKQKMSKAKKGKTGKLCPNSKPVICITTNQVFYAVMDAERYCNIANSNIANCCKGKTKSAGKLPDGTKLVWKYIDIIEL